MEQEELANFFQDVISGSKNEITRKLRNLESRKQKLDARGIKPGQTSFKNETIAGEVKIVVSPPSSALQLGIPGQCHDLAHAVGGSLIRSQGIPDLRRS